MAKTSKPTEWAKKIKELMEASGLNQAALASKLESDSSQGTVTQGAISNWLRAAGDYAPSSRMFAQLGNVAVEYGLDPLWFWEQAGFDRTAAVSFAEQMLKKMSKKTAPGEIVEIPLFSTEQLGSGDAEQADARMFRIPADGLANPVSTVALEVAKDAATIPFGVGDLLIVDRSATGLPSLWDKVIAVRLDPSAASGAGFGLHWRTGLSFGLLRLLPVGGGTSEWAAQLIPLGGSGEEGIPIGSWDNAELAKRLEQRKPALGNAIHMARLNAARKIDKAYLDAYARDFPSGPPLANVPKTRAQWESIDEAGKEAGEQFMAPYHEAAKTQSRLEAQAKLRSAEGCHVIGRVVSWRSATGEAKD
jgi:transcriptional regulator with XRE-family HTH domain